MNVQQHVHLKEAFAYIMNAVARDVPVFFAATTPSCSTGARYPMLPSDRCRTHTNSCRLKDSVGYWAMGQEQT